MPHGSANPGAVSAGMSLQGAQSVTEEAKARESSQKFAPVPGTLHPKVRFSTTSSGRPMSFFTLSSNSCGPPDSFSSTANPPQPRQVLTSRYGSKGTTFFEHPSRKSQRLLEGDCAQLGHISKPSVQPCGRRLSPSVQGLVSQIS